MKKLIVALVLFASLAVVGSQVFARGSGFGHMGGFGAGGYSSACPAWQGAGDVQDIDPSARQAFLDETRELRAELSADRNELWSLRSKTDSDPERIRVLSGEIFNAREQLRRLATEHGLTGTGMAMACPGPGFGKGRMMQQKRGGYGPY